MKELIPLPSNYIHALNKERTFISIERNIGVRYLKLVQIKGWGTVTDPCINGTICILKCITDIQNPVSESIHIHIINIDS